VICFHLHFCSCSLLSVKQIQMCDLKSHHCCFFSLDLYSVKSDIQIQKSDIFILMMKQKLKII